MVEKHLSARLVNSLVVSRVTYSLPYHVTIKAEREQAEAILRKAYKTALHLPRNTSNDKLMQLGISNTFEELKERQLKAQARRLSNTTTGRALLTKLGWETEKPQSSRAIIPDLLRKKLRIQPVPRNMDPNLHTSRRQARAEFYERTMGQRDNTVYTDASLYPKGHRKHAVAVVANNQSKLIRSLTVAVSDITEAEEIAVALAAEEGYRIGKSLNILTDSQEACRNYIRGRISSTALKILSRAPLYEGQPTHNIIWIPSHAGIQGNEGADSLARGFTIRADTSVPPGEPQITCGDSYSELLNLYRGRRFQYPPPHKPLTKEEAAGWRRLQTGSFPNLYILSRMFPTQYCAVCPWCGARPTLYHITWECERNKTFHKHTTPSAEQWESRVTSCELGVQRALIAHTSEVARLSGALD
nr:uncharacterized protein LOC129388244 [Dermacentor andersoni]